MIPTTTEKPDLPRNKRRRAVREHPMRHRPVLQHLPARPERARGRECGREVRAGRHWPDVCDVPVCLSCPVLSPLPFPFFPLFVFPFLLFFFFPFLSLSSLMSAGADFDEKSRYRNCNGGRVAANTAAFGFTRVSATSVGWVPASFQCEPRFRLFRGLRRVVVVPTPDYFMGPVE